MKKILLALFLFGTWACTFENEEELFGEEIVDPCDAEDVSYSLDVVPIMVSHCYTCHSTANAPSNGANIVLEGYARLKVFADNGFLSKSINHEAPAASMPRNASKLSDCKIKTIDQWISEGTLDN
ncbi:hypothetical protein R9C00_14115 [Flammeovirgaceae bacterium SG7u.111]|nr:hypothetical protein [Flammeovirgaceae bacterium SG7u.132]WPO38591.1 hypothetical protein R9C00_14115 [Flammeovirgaceae bacterium SG7u.111]